MSQRGIQHKASAASAATSRCDGGPREFRVFLSRGPGKGQMSSGRIFSTIQIARNSDAKFSEEDLLFQHLDEVAVRRGTGIDVELG